MSEYGDVVSSLGESPVSKRRSRPPRQRKDHGRESSPPPAGTSASIAPPAEQSALSMGSEVPPPLSELDELDAGWDKLLV